METPTLQDRARAYVLQPDEGEMIDTLRLRLLATDDDTRGMLTAAVCTNPGPGGPPLHSHAAVDELYYVLQGRYRFKIGDEAIEGGPGTFASIPRGTSHTFASVGPDEGRLLAITLPGTERFLREMADLQEQGTDQRAMVAHFQRFSSSIDGPPLV